LSREDKEWLLSLRDRLWVECDADSFGHVWKVERDDVVLSAGETERIYSLVLSHRLMTRMSSGTFGLPGYGFQVYQNDDPPCPGAEQPPELLLIVSDKHLPYPKGTKGDNQKELNFAWTEFSRFTHSLENRDLLKRHRMSAPRERQDYDY